MLTEIKEREKQSLTSAELNVIDWINENEEKRSQQVRCKLPVVGSDTTLDDIIVHHHDKHFHESDKTTRRQRSLRTLPVPLRHTQHDNQQQHTVEQQSECHLRNGNIPRTNLLSGCIILYQFTFVFTSFGSDGKSFISPSILFETGRKERVPTCSATINNNR